MTIEQQAPAIADMLPLLCCAAGVKEITVTIEEPFSILALEAISNTALTNVSARRNKGLCLKQQPHAEAAL